MVPRLEKAKVHRARQIAAHIAESLKGGHQLQCLLNRVDGAISSVPRASWNRNAGRHDAAAAVRHLSIAAVNHHGIVGLRQMRDARDGAAPSPVALLLADDAADQLAIQAFWRGKEHPRRLRHGSHAALVIGGAAPVDEAILQLGGEWLADVVIDGNRVHVRVHQNRRALAVAEGKGGDHVVAPLADASLRGKDIVLVKGGVIAGYARNLRPHAAVELRHIVQTRPLASGILVPRIEIDRRDGDELAAKSNQTLFIQG